MQANWSEEHERADEVARELFVTSLSWTSWIQRRLRIQRMMAMKMNLRAGVKFANLRVKFTMFRDLEQLKHLTKDTNEA